MPKRPAAMSCFAVTAPGLEALCAAELAALGISAERRNAGGVAFAGDLGRRGAGQSVASHRLARARSRRRVPRDGVLRARASGEANRVGALRRAGRARLVPRDMQEVEALPQRRGRAAAGGRGSPRRAERRDGRESKGTTTTTRSPARTGNCSSCAFCTTSARVSVDSSGALLHMRGYRQQIAKAPLRETLAAAVLLGAGWTGDTPLADPMCGSGTIPIEAALIARRIAPGRDRTFAFQAWPKADAAIVVVARRRRARGRAAARSRGDRAATTATPARSPPRAPTPQRAGVLDDIEFDVQPISALAAAEPPGLIALNPPYGVRIGEARPAAQPVRAAGKRRAARASRDGRSRCSRRIARSSDMSGFDSKNDSRRATAGFRCGSSSRTSRRTRKSRRGRAGRARQSARGRDDGTHRLAQPLERRRSQASGGRSAWSRWTACRAIIRRIDVITAVRTARCRSTRSS